MEKIFDIRTYQINENIDTLMITEVKLDESFPIGQFSIIAFGSPFSPYRSRSGGDILL